MRVGHTGSYAQYTAATNLVGSLRVPYTQYVRVDFNLSPLLLSHISLLSIVGLTSLMFL
jgi:hypothetical protein